MPVDHKIEAVHGSHEWTGGHGTFIAYDLELEGGKRVEMNQKPETPAPTVGQIIYGDLVEQGGRFKLKKAQRQDGATSMPAPAGDVQRSIVRQHSQEMALQHCRNLGLIGKLPDTYSVENLRPIIDWFERDAKGEA